MNGPKETIGMFGEFWTDCSVSFNISRVFYISPPLNTKTAVSALSEDDLVVALLSFMVKLQRLRSLLIPDEQVFNEVEEREGISRKKLIIK